MLKNNKELDIFVSFIVLTFCAAVYYLTLGFPMTRSMASSDPIGAKGFPQLLTGVLAVLAVTVIIQAVLNKTKDGDKPAKINGKDFLALLKFIVALVVYVYAIRYLGYCVSTLLFMMFGMWWMGQRKPVTIVMTGVVITVLIYLCFGWIFKVDLPSGLLI